MTFPGIDWIKAPAPETDADTAELSRVVADVLARVRAEGDAAVADFARRFDSSDAVSFEVTLEQREAAVAALDPQTRADTEFAIANVRRFAQAQLACLTPLDVEVLPGAFLGHRIIPVQRVGCYVPSARDFSRTENLDRQLSRIAAPVRAASVAAARYSGRRVVSSVMRS